MAKTTFIKENETDPIAFDLNSILPGIVKQYEELKGGFQEFEVTWIVIKPNLEEVVIPGGQEALIGEALSGSYGDFTLKFGVRGEMPTFRVPSYGFLSGSEYVFPIQVTDQTPVPVVEQGLNGTVKDKDTNLPIPSATIELKDGNTVVATKTTGVDGKYEIADLEAKEYSISAAADGYKTVLSTITIPSGEVVTKDFLMVKGTGTIDENENPGDKDGSLIGGILPKTGNMAVLVIGVVILLMGDVLIRETMVRNSLKK